MESIFEGLQDPLDFSLEDLTGTPLQIHFALGIVNPFGPTLNIVATAGKHQVGSRLPVIRAMLNPFSQVIQQVGWETVGEIWYPRLDLKPFLGLDFGDCPTFITVRNAVPDVERVNLIADILMQFDSGVRENCARVTAFFGNPWDRVSDAMSGREPVIDDNEPISIVANRYAGMLLKPEHFWNELSAFLYAWQGSIEQTGISGEMKSGAFQFEEFKDLLWEAILPSLYLPPQPEEHGGTGSKEAADQPKLEFESIEDVRDMLRSEDWKQLNSENLLILLKSSIILYGVEVDAEDVPHISKLYKHILRSGISSDDRYHLENQIRDVQEQHRLPPIVYLPFLVEDPDTVVAAEAVVDFVSTSPYLEDDPTKLYALVEIEALFDNESLSNPGAVFGSLLSMGEERFNPLLDKMRETLTPDQVSKATGADSQFAKHAQIQYWLRWANELVTATSEREQKIFGDIASAISRAAWKCARHHGVQHIQRNFPSIGNDNFFTVLDKWTFEEYSELIAPQLYALEAQEPAPKLFSSVLMCWGLKPAAQLNEQYLPGPGADSTIPDHLRDLSKS